MTRDEPNAPKRLIISGSDPEPETAPPSRLILPGDEPAAEAPKSRIILPPGAASESVEVPEYPRLRPLLMVPFSDGQRELVLVQDPIGVIPGQPVLGIESLGLLQLFDGTTSLNDITAAVMRESKDLRIGNMVRDFVAQLDQLYMLETPRFETAYAALRDAYHQLEIRPAALQGRSYPADRDELEKFLDGHFESAVAMREAENGSAARARAPRALLAPHLDPRRAGPLIARAIIELDPEAAGPLRVVVYGTGHGLIGDLFALTRKHFETALGKVTCDTAFVDHIAGKLGDLAWHGELAHRDEHSIEFLAVYLKRHFGDREVTIVPILCGGFHSLLDDGITPRDSAAFESLIAAIRGAEQKLGGPTVHVASVDFSHIGPRFGDPAVDDRTQKEVEDRDRAAIEAARLGDGDRWFETIAAGDDDTRICGFAPTYAMLRAAEPGEGRLLRYDRSDEPDSSFVSVATMAW